MPNTIPIPSDLGPISTAPQADKYYRHIQMTPATVWHIHHGLRKRPAVTVVDSGGNKVLTDVVYIDNDNLDIVCSVAFGGEAYLD